MSLSGLLYWRPIRSFFWTLKGAQSPAQTIEENGCLKKRSLTDGWQKEQGGQAWRRESSKAQSHQQSRMKMNEEGKKKSSAATMRKKREPDERRGR